MKKLQIFLYTASCVVLLATGAFAQFRDAGAKIRGDNFVPGDLNDARMRQQHAADHARILYHYGKMQQPVPQERLQDHAAALKQNTAAARKSIAKVKAVDPKDAELQKRAEAIDAMLAKCDAECETLSKQVSAEKPDKDKICACCAHAYEHLEKARGETERLMKDLGIKTLDAPKHEHDAPEKKTETKK